MYGFHLYNKLLLLLLLLLLLYTSLYSANRPMWKYFRDAFTFSMFS